MVSASANARLCSNMERATSVMTGICCSEQDRFSTRCDKLNRRKVGQSKENEPRGALTSGSGLLIPIAAHDCSSLDQNRMEEETRWRAPPSVDQSRMLYLSISPCRYRENSGDV